MNTVPSGESGCADDGTNQSTMCDTYLSTSSLGTVLLEIAPWRTLETFAMKGEPSWDFQNRLLVITFRELPGQVGQIYANVVKECLSTTKNDKDEDTQRKLCWDIISRLDQCVA